MHIWFIGWFEVFLDRRLNQDDNRGLQQGVTDNRETPAYFRIVLEERSNQFKVKFLVWPDCYTSNNFQFVKKLNVMKRFYSFFFSPKICIPKYIRNPLPFKEKKFHCQPILLVNIIYNFYKFNTKCIKITHVNSRTIILFEHPGCWIYCCRTFIPKHYMQNQQM